ncbi:hypothetical protein B7P43_G17646 [Cryptotermes secundus]|uniref:CCHC-type domain-containing protein n=1 Tax=Cryptotermes secundus TaxID=105785 RepID=A0A2J7Q3S9_9NEOP|nr:hypothetical protein B7P43_G17646 [Cryptotermes secundus]
MCQKTIRMVNDEETQRVINEEAERRLLAAYIHGLRGVVDQQVRYQMPNKLDQAVKLAVTIENVEKHQRLKEGPRIIFAARQDARCYRCAKQGHYARDCRQAPGHVLPGWRTQGGPRGNGRSGPPYTQTWQHEEIGPEDHVEDEKSGDQRGLGFPMMTVARLKFSVTNAVSMGIYVGIAHGCPGPIRPQTGMVRHSAPQCRTHSQEDRSIADDRCRARAPVGNRNRGENSSNVSRFRSKCECDKTRNCHV